MPRCLACGENTDHQDQLMEVRTLHVRDFSGERRVQALGKTVCGSVCDACAKNRHSQLLMPGKALTVRVAAFLILAVAGGVLYALIPGLPLPLRLPCVGAVLLGLLGAGTSIQTAAQTRRLLEHLPPDQALEAARREVMLKCLPGKEGDNHLTYLSLSTLLDGEIPALVAEHGLLPAIAKEAVARAGQPQNPCAEQSKFAAGQH